MRVLLVEDELPTAKIVRASLLARGLLVDIGTTGEDALWMAHAVRYAVICLDVNLPGIDGFETCRRLRDQGVATPVLMLTARDDVADRIAGLDGGADDYLVKPFDAGELAARIRALARRLAIPTRPVLVVGDVRLDLATQRVWVIGVEVDLTVKEVQVLEVFMRRPDQVLSRLDLLEGAWDGRSEHRSNVIDVFVKRLRAKLDHPFGRSMLETVRGAGYRFRAG